MLDFALMGLLIAVIFGVWFGIDQYRVKKSSHHR